MRTCVRVGVRDAHERSLDLAEGRGVGHERQTIKVVTQDETHDAVALELLTRGAGLSLGDRMCLSLARALDLPAYMADRTWANVSVDVKIVVIR